MSVRADDPGPLQINGIVGAQAGYGVVVGMSVLKTQLIPVAQGPRNIRGVCDCLVCVVPGVLHTLEEEPCRPLPAPLVSEIGIHAIGLYGLAERTELGAARCWHDIKATIAAEHFRGPGDTLELIVSQRFVAQNEVHSLQAAPGLGEPAAGELSKRDRIAIGQGEYASVVYSLRI